MTKKNRRERETEVEQKEIDGEGGSVGDTEVCVGEGMRECSHNAIRGRNKEKDNLLITLQTFIIQGHILN